MYQIIERQMGLRVFSRINLLTGYMPGDEAAHPRASLPSPNHGIINSSGSQAEVDFKGQDSSTGDQEPGEEVPGGFREHRHTYSKMPDDIDAYRRQLAYRCGHIGTKELEIVLRDYLTLYMHKMTRAELE